MTNKKPRSKCIRVPVTHGHFCTTKQFSSENNSLIKMAGRYLFDAPKSPFDAVWRLASTLVLASCLVVGYGIVARPQLVRAVIGVEDVQQESVEHRLLQILENRSLDKLA